MVVGVGLVRVGRQSRRTRCLGGMHARRRRMKGRPPTGD